MARMPDKSCATEHLECGFQFAIHYYKEFFVNFASDNGQDMQTMSLSTRRHRKYRITVEDESHLTEVVTMRTTRLRMVAIAVAWTVVSFIVSGVIIALTPLRTLLPGYMKESQRSATEEGLLRLDSLMQAYEENEKFVSNFMTVIDTERTPADSTAVRLVSRELTSDSLSTATPLEQKFVNGMEESERFNISVLAPLAADGISFSPVTTEGVFTSASRTSTTGEVILSPDESVHSVADGAVIAIYKSTTGPGHTIIVQHVRGFVTAYGHTGTPLVGIGDQVNSGQTLAMPPTADSRGARRITVSMWHNGTTLVPYDYLGDPGRRHNSSGESFESPRGR